MDQPTCDGEHLIVHKLRKLPVYIPELDFVAEMDGKIVGHIIYSMAKVVQPDEQEIEVLNFGPISVLPGYKRMGIGSALMNYSIAEAKKLGYRAIIFYGHPDYYPRFGFKRASQYGITSIDGRSFDALMAMELYSGSLDGITGRYIEDDVYNVAQDELEEFEKRFVYKEPVQLLPIEVLTEALPENVGCAILKQGVKTVSGLNRFSGRELLTWEGIDEPMLLKINEMLSKLGFPKKKLPSSWFAETTEMNMYGK